MKKDGDSKKLKELEKKIVELKKEVEEANCSWRRALADYQNLVRRTDEERGSVYEGVKKDLILKFLPIMDYLENALKHDGDEGVELMVREFKKTLEGEGVEKIEVEGEKFDPAVMDCVDVTEGGKEGEVAEVLLNGYKMGDEVIRQAKVRVYGEG